MGHSVTRQEPTQPLSTLVCYMYAAEPLSSLQRRKTNVTSEVIGECDVNDVPISEDAVVDEQLIIRPTSPV